MIKVGVIGATGYTGEEIIKILAKHDGVTLTVLQALVDEEKPISQIFPHLAIENDLICKKPKINEAVKKLDVVFLALPHRVSMTVAGQFLQAKKGVIDLSADYRLSVSDYEKWYGIKHKDKTNLDKAVYGLPELYREKIEKAKLVANPGCYPTSALIPTIPLIEEGLVDLKNIIIDSKSGVTGAGRKPHIELSFGEVNDNLKAYKVNEHQHKPEINMILSKLGKTSVDVTFVPHLVPMNRGILSTVYMGLKKAMTTKEVLDLYRDFYKGEPFVKIMDERLPRISDVVNTNFCSLGIKVAGKKIIVISCIDNLLKGAAGQAVQNMNIMEGLDEKKGLL